MKSGKELFNGVKELNVDQQGEILAKMSVKELADMWIYYSVDCRFHEDHKIGDRLVSMICYRFVELVDDSSKQI